MTEIKKFHIKSNGGIYYISTGPAGLRLCYSTNKSDTIYCELPTGVFLFTFSYPPSVRSAEFIKDGYCFISRLFCCL